ncbi:potassium-transporting ATPase subunit C [Arthrobacter sp. KBS0703]|uniref:potassium-transporting ATPase subunit C n=1 Tax=Arthrobacter sp. KBS0703 TaxID=1955698 RepID=UPI00098F4CB3|nr:potassium-transporting ATPase subunit C [Arthrobacter sp. KBS0703]TSE15780.1 potassium-transporting ATPase subunit C [Arthrobacter sp. KBS0703]
MNTLLGYLRQAGTAVRFLALATLVLGLLYPVAVFGLGQVLAPAQANGSILKDAAGNPAASTRLVQAPADEKGVQDQRWFHARPSAVKWDPASSSASNLGPNDPNLAKNVEAARETVAAAEGIDPARVPADAVTASGSGLDPSISVAYAQLQVPRIAAAHRLSDNEVKALVERNTTSGLEAFLGQPSVNVTTLNLDLATR